MPLMALTATATSFVMGHLKQLLGNPTCEISSVNKTNIVHIKYLIFNPKVHCNTKPKSHPVHDYMITSNLTWVLCMSPLMAQLLGEAEFMEADVTYKASIEFEYLFNVVVFNYTTLRCKLYFQLLCTCILCMCTILLQGMLLPGSALITSRLRHMSTASSPCFRLSRNLPTVCSWQNTTWGGS